MILPSLSIVPYAHNRAGNMFTQFPLDGGFTVSSSDQGTIVNADGIIERSPRNLCINTQNFTAGSWAQTGSPSVINNVDLAPDGTMTAAYMTNGQIQYAAGIGVIGKQYTCSLYIRRISGTGTVRFRAIENVNTPVSVTSEWQRFSLTVAATTTTLRIGINLELGSSTVAIWGAQIEESLTPTPYQRVDASRLNFPRIDWFGQSCPGLLVEPSAQNLCLQSEDFTTTWMPTNVTVSSNVAGTTDPAGGNTADQIFETAVSGLHFLAQTMAIVSGTTYAGSVFLKKAAGSPDWMQVAFSTTGLQGFANFNLTSGTVGNVFAGATGRIENYGNGWYRCTLIQTATASGTSGGPIIVFTNNTDPITRFVNYTVNTATSIYAWGAQLETGSNATSYIPTTTTTASRAADVINASGVSGLIGQTEGTMYFQIRDLKGLATATGNPALAIRDTAFTNWIGLTSNSVSTPFRIQVKSTATTLINYTSAITEGKAAIAYSANGAVVYVNGSQVASTATNPNLTLNMVMMEQYMPFKVESLALYTTRLDNYELMAMTSLDTSYEQLAARLSYAT